MRLILIRHGQTASNVAGALDTAVPGAPLTALGLEQAAALVDLLADERVDAVYASTQERSQQTAAPLAAARGVEVVVRAGIREIGAGEFEMRDDRDAVAGYIATFTSVAAGRFEAANPAGETGREIIDRFDAVVDEIHARGDETVVVVSHGAMIRTWTGLRAGNLDVDFIAANPLANTAVVVLDGDPVRGWTALTWAGSGLGPGADEATAGPTGERVERGF